MTLLAVFGLLAGPVAAAAGSGGCELAADAPAIAAMAMPVLAGMDQAGAPQPQNSPCCDPLHQKKTQHRSCTLSCACCVATMAMLDPARRNPLLSRSLDRASPPLVAAHPYAPPLLKRPPRLIA